MSMYKIKPCSFQKFLWLSKHSIEMSSDLDEKDFDNTEFDCLYFGNKALAIIGKEEIVDTESGQRFISICAAISPDVKNHLSSFIKECIKYLDLIQKYPLMTMAEVNRKKFGRFLRFLKFYTDEKYVVKFEKNGIIYNIYVRG